MKEFYEQIEAYLQGELNDAERQAFEDHLQKDETLARSVEAHRAMMNRMEGARIRSNVKNAIEDYKTQQKHTPFFTQPTAWALAATIVLLLTAVWFMSRPETPDSPQIAVEQPIDTSTAPKIQDKEPKLEPQPPVQPDTRGRALAMAKNQFEPPSPTMIRDAMESTANAPRTPIQLAGEAYVAKEYRKAANILADESLVANDENARFLRAGARFKSGQYELAASDYEKLLRSFEFKHEARWNEMLCRMAVGKPVDSLLKKMATDENFAFKNRAKQLQATIR
ncbi:MAG: hypothetical protein JNJ57_11660 [Saprospiraceae bacterium]|nr:hypothetical protein [Saprospiraceae bacterium]